MTELEQFKQMIENSGNSYEVFYNTPAKELIGLKITKINYQNYKVPHVVATFYFDEITGKLVNFF